MQFCMSLNVILVCFVREVKLSVDCSWYDNVVVQNMYLKGHMFYQSSLPSVYDCAAKCVMSSVCKAFNFDLKTKLCHLNRNNSDEAETATKKEFVYSDIRHWPGTVAGLCFAKRCGTDYDCDVDRLGRPICKQAFAGCDVPPTISNTEVTYNGSFLHSEAVYTCRNNFRSCDQSGSTWRLTCEVSGKWYGASGTCERYRWINPSLLQKKSFRIPCGSTDKVKVTFTCTPLKKTHFSVSFKALNDTLFYVDIRFNRNGDIKVLVVNSRKGKRWGQRLLLRVFPFAVNLPSHVEITLQHGRYKLFVNGNEVVSFIEGWPGTLPELFKIHGAVKVHDLQINV